MLYAEIAISAIRGYTYIPFTQMLMDGSGCMPVA